MEIHTLLEYVHFQGVFFAILCTSLALILANKHMYISVDANQLLQC
jgi:hypothetical protein